MSHHENTSTCIVSHTRDAKGELVIRRANSEQLCEYCCVLSLAEKPGLLLGITVRSAEK